MSWCQLKLYTSKENAESWSELLTTTGAVAIIIHGKEQKAIIEPTPGDLPLWDQIQIIGLYQDNIDIALIKTQLFQHLGKDLDLHTEILQEEDWQDIWKKDLKPIKFGNNLWICPSWCEIPKPQEINIILDPGMAFGTGTHPTTALCLEWLTENIKEETQVMDFGCGSGILAIATIKLGAKFAYCIDCDPQALISTKDNAYKNSINNKQLKTLLPQELAPNIQVDLLIANILANPLQELAEKLADYVKPYGKIVLSGILQNQTSELINIYSKWFKNIEITNKEEWVRITGIKK